MFSVGPEAIDPQALVSAVVRPQCGAAVVFTGIVREKSDDLRDVAGLHYEAHESMAAAEIETIAGEAVAAFGPCNIAAAHRTGDLRVGEIAVAVAVASAHRAQAFDACEFVIDAIKARAPIWKKEHFTDGAAEWRENDCQSAAHSRGA